MRHHLFQVMNFHDDGELLQGVKFKVFSVFYVHQVIIDVFRRAAMQRTLNSSMSSRASSYMLLTITSLRSSQSVTVSSCRHLATSPRATIKRIIKLISQTVQIAACCCPHRTPEAVLKTSRTQRRQCSYARVHSRGLSSL